MFLCLGPSVFLGVQIGANPRAEGDVKGHRNGVSASACTTMVARNYVGPLQEASWFLVDYFLGVPRCYSRTEL